MIRPVARARVVAPRLFDVGWRAASTVRHHVEPWFASSAILYLVIATLLVFRAGFIVGDAWSRVGNAAWMITSRDPHLAAIGFVWNPLPSLVILPFVAVRDIWSPLVSVGFAANIVAILFMAGSVVVLDRIGVDLRVPKTARRLLVGLFAIHPMIVLYGANGMSEAPFMFLLLVAVRALLAWWRNGATTPLVVVGLALGLAYLTRYEAVAAAIGALIVVAVRTLQRTAGDRQLRQRWAAADLLIAGLPFAFAFGGWALASWIITGNPFETFTSVYGNSSQVSLARTSIAETTGRGLDAVRFALSEILGIAPTLPVLGVVVAVLAIRRRSFEAIVPIAVLGAVLGFAVLTTITGSSFAWLRFSITAIPLTVLLAFLTLSPTETAASGAESNLAVAAGPEPAPADQEAGRAPLAWPRGVFQVGRTAIVVALVAAMLPVALATMTNPRIGREEFDQVRAIANGRDPAFASVQQAEIGAQVATYLDGLGLPAGSVIVDVAVGFQIVLQSRDPHQFVITPDRDFQRVLANPEAFDATYLLVPSGSGYASLDAVGREHPGVFENGAGIATLVREFGSGVFAWRLYRVD